MVGNRKGMELQPCWRAAAGRAAAMVRRRVAGGISARIDAGATTNCAPLVFPGASFPSMLSGASSTFLLVFL